MELNQTYETIAGWIESCVTDEHLDTLQGVIVTFVTKQYYPTSPDFYLEEIKRDLNEQLRQKRIFISHRPDLLSRLQNRISYVS